MSKEFIQSIIYAILAIAAAIITFVLLHKGYLLSSSYSFTFAVWAWGKSDYYSLKDKI